MNDGTICRMVKLDETGSWRECGAVKSLAQEFCGECLVAARRTRSGYHHTDNDDADRKELIALRREVEELRAGKKTWKPEHSYFAGFVISVLTDIDRTSDDRLETIAEKTIDLDISRCDTVPDRTDDGRGPWLAELVCGLCGSNYTDCDCAKTGRR